MSQCTPSGAKLAAFFYFYFKNWRKTNAAPSHKTNSLWFKTFATISARRNSSSQLQTDLATTTTANTTTITTYTTTETTKITISSFIKLMQVFWKYSLKKVLLLCCQISVLRLSLQTVPYIPFIFLVLKQKS